MAKGPEMTNRTTTTSMQPSQAAEVHSTVGDDETSHSVRRAAVIAGAGLLLMTAFAVGSIAFEGLITRDDAAKTAADITASSTRFGLGVVSLMLVAALDVVVAWALFIVLRPANEGLSRLAAWFRVAYAVAFLVAIAQLAGIPRLLDTLSSRGAFDADQVNALAMERIRAFDDIWSAGFLLFGLHLLVLGYLAYRSGYVPRTLGALVAIAGFGYAFDSITALLPQGPSFELATFTFLGELLLALWLVTRGRRITLSASTRQRTTPV